MLLVVLEELFQIKQITRSDCIKEGLTSSYTEYQKRGLNLGLTGTELRLN